jgi:hypothetical protein
MEKDLWVDFQIQIERELHTHHVISFASSINPRHLIKMFERK